MNRYLNIILLVLICFSASGQTDYYWHKGKKIYLERNDSKKYILCEDVSDSIALKHKLLISGLRVESFRNVPVLSGVNLAEEKSGPNHIRAVVSSQQGSLLNLSDNQHIIYEAPYYFTSHGKEVGISHRFYVRLFKESDVSQLEGLASKNKVKILGRNKFMPLWYILSCSNASKGNAIQMANSFYETGLFKAAEPGMMVPNVFFCVNDEEFDNQWGLLNTGQNGGTAGIDINACQAWQTTTGSSDVVVAVFDEGIQLNHPDLPNIYPESYDVVDNSTPSNVYGNHGTRVAGIIGAAHNTSVIAGVTPDCPLMSISSTLPIIPPDKQQYADGINWAWQNGADVINNSWGDNDLLSEAIDEAIVNALTMGRDGLGSVVAFATGNDNAAVQYPANYHDDIIAVGAISPCGERKRSGDDPEGVSCDGETWWGSNTGVWLDVMAPGVFIPTTDWNSGYKPDFGGTSAACPHVSGVAALVLSVRPCLSQQDVGDIIELTAQKVGGYDYQVQNYQGYPKPNGTYHIQMGYGLVDAEAAVDLAATYVRTLEEMIFDSDETIKSCDIELHNCEITNNANILFEVNNTFTITGTFNATVGSTLEIN